MLKIKYIRHNDSQIFARFLKKMRTINKKFDNYKELKEELLTKNNLGRIYSKNHKINKQKINQK